QDEVTDDQRLERHHEARQNDEVDQSPAGKGELRDRVAAGDAHEHHQPGDRDRRHDRVDVPDTDLGVDQRKQIGIESDVLRYEIQSWLNHFILWLEAGTHRQIQRKRPKYSDNDGNDRDDVCRDIEIAEPPEADSRYGLGEVAGRHQALRVLSTWY